MNNKYHPTETEVKHRQFDVPNLRCLFSQLKLCGRTQWRKLYILSTKSVTFNFRSIQSNVCVSIFIQCIHFYFIWWTSNNNCVWLCWQGVSCYLVPIPSDGLARPKFENKMGIRASSTGLLVFEDCKIPADYQLGKDGDGFKIAMSALDGGRIGKLRW